MMSFLGGALQDLLMVSARPSADKKGIILHLREVDGKALSIPVYLLVYSSSTGLASSTHARAAFEVNVLEEIIQRITGNLEFNPFETKFIKLEFYLDAGRWKMENGNYFRTLRLLCVLSLPAV